MSLESFIGLGDNEGMSESAFEAFQEKMKAAAAQIAAIRKEEKKQKKKEDDLLKILLKFIKDSKKTRLVLLISRVLEQNIPANFILTIILLGNEDIQREVGKFLMLENGGLEEARNEKSLIFFQEDQTLPLKVKIELDNWLKGLLFQAEERPQKLLKTAIDEEGTKVALIKLVAFVIKDYLEQKGIEENIDKTDNFAKFILRGILSKTAENLENRQFLG